MKILEFRKILSTNLKAKELAKKGAALWTVVLAKEQRAGYGRKGTTWFSPLGGLYFSIILPNPVRNNISNGAKSKIEDLQTLTILAAFIIAKALKKNFSLEPLIKLPNDVLLNGKKICGILTENVIGKEIKLSVMGIGLNTNIDKFPKDLENTATSLKIELGREIDNKKILSQIVKGLQAQLATVSE